MHKIFPQPRKAQWVEEGEKMHKIFPQPRKAQ